MKGEYLDHHHHHQKHESPNMFSKLTPHHHHHHQQHHHHHNNPLPFSSHFQLARDSEDDDTRSTGAAITNSTPPSKTIETPNSGGTDGATIEVVRRPRGRPPGSKNKPKPPVIITRNSEPAMSPYILEVPGGCDIVEALSRFCRRKNISICVLTGSGTVANVTFRQPSTTPGSTITFHGRFDILSLSATFMPQNVNSPVPITFSISLAGPQGQIVGGLVAGSLIAAGTVYVIAATFINPSYHRLPIEEEGRNSGSGGGGGGGEGQSPAVSGGGGAGGDSAGGSGGGGGEACGGGGDGGGGMVMYSGHLPSDVIWAPTARPPQPPPPF